LPECKHIRVARIDRDLNPVVERVAKSFHAGEILDQRIAGLALHAAHERLFDAKVVAVAIHENEGFVIGLQFLHQRSAQVRKAVNFRGGIAGKGENVRKHVGLLHDHHGAGRVQRRQKVQKRRKPRPVGNDFA